MTADVHDLERLIALGLLSEGEEREACNDLDPDSGFVRHPPTPHLLNTFITPDDQLFQTIHMGAAVVNQNRYIIKVDGLVERPFSLSMAQLKQFPSTTVTAFHECYGPPLKAPTENYWRIGNIEWTGARLKTVLDLARPLPEAQFVWSDGLDYGQFGGVQADRYQKDLPIEKALSSDVLLAYEINGKPLSRNRGGPVRLVVPGWFGTNMTKWLCRLSLQPHRAPGPFTTIFYNEKDPTDPRGGMRPVWQVEPNSMITSPTSNSQLKDSVPEICGWAWSNDGIKAVHISKDDGKSWLEAGVEPRMGFSWQQFRTKVDLPPGRHRIIARATSSAGLQQPLSGRRNHVHTIEVEILS